MGGGGAEEEIHTINIKKNSKLMSSSIICQNLSHPSLFCRFHSHSARSFFTHLNGSSKYNLHFLVTLLKEVCHENREPRWLWKMANSGYWSGTMAIDIILLFNFAVVFISM